MDRNLALEFVRVTEMAAIASAGLMGRGDEEAADQAAVDAMRTMLDSVSCHATVVIGEGERTRPHALYWGRAGRCCLSQTRSRPRPLEGTSICAQVAPTPSQ